MYDENYKMYMQTRDKEMDTVEDAIVYLAALRLCGDCKKCPVKMYKGSDGACGCYKEKASELVRSEFGFEDFRGETDDIAELLYTIYLDRSPVKERKPTGLSCKECLRYREHSSGIGWCDSFGNFVHSDGYCYRYEDSDKID